MPAARYGEGADGGYRGSMTSEPSWLLLAIALALVLALTGLAAWLAATEVRAVRPAPAGRRAAPRVGGGTTGTEQKGPE